MDVAGWIPLGVISGFNRIRMMTPEPVLVLEAIKGSATVEVEAVGGAEGHRLRKMAGWEEWVMSEAERSGAAAAQAAASAAAQGGNVNGAIGGPGPRGPTPPPGPPGVGPGPGPPSSRPLDDLAADFVKVGRCCLTPGLAQVNPLVYARLIPG
jgi:hypothetical protein